MTETTEIDATPSSKRSKLPLLLGIVFLLLGAGGGFVAVSMGVLSIGTGSANDAPQTVHRDTEEAAFVALEPIIVSFQQGSGRSLLRFTAQLDVMPSAVSEVEKIKPRIVDILNGYLRALEIEDLEEPAALMKIRSQMLHRVKIVAGADLINDLLVMEFVLN